MQTTQANRILEIHRLLKEYDGDNPGIEQLRATMVELLEEDHEIKDLLRRCGVTADLDAPRAFWTEFRAVALQDLHLTDNEFFEREAKQDVIAMLRRRVFEIERTKQPITQRRVSGSSPNDALRQTVKELWDLAGNSNRDRRCLFVCGQLDARGIKPPTGATWKHLSFVKAYKDEKYRSAVQKMMSSLRK